jgi:hypothetical protein
MARTGVIDRDRGWARFLEALPAMGSPKVAVGILQDKGGEVDEEGGITLAGIAAVNEFGSEDGHIPERSFLRSTVDDNEAVYLRELMNAAGAAVDAMVQQGATGAEAVLEQGLGVLGARVKRDVQNKIRDLRDPPNAEATLAAKYPGDNPLIDTGRMRQSIAFAVLRDGGGDGGGG